jgi:hypothetical protein
MWELQEIFWQLGYTDANWGTALGLRPGPMSLLPLLAIWAAGLAMLYGVNEKRPIKAGWIDTEHEHENSDGSDGAGMIPRTHRPHPTHPGAKTG